MEFREAVPLECISEPNRTQKLHPYENEDEEEWEQFRDSVGTEPNKPIELKRNGDGYEIIDGDRRFRALKENDAEEVAAFIRDDDEVATEREKSIKMVMGNEMREPSDKKQRAWHVAQWVAPWLLPPGERMIDSEDEMMTQSEYAQSIGKKESFQGRISRWLNPIRNERALRDVVAGKASGHRPDWDDIEYIDSIVDLLLTGGSNGDRVIAPVQEEFTAEELADMEGISLRELESAAEKAVTEGRNSQAFLQYVEENFAIDEMNREDEDVDIDSGILSGDNEFEDDSGILSNDDFEPSVDEEPEETETDELSIDDVAQVSEVDWVEVVDDTGLSTPLSVHKNQRMMTQAIEDDAAVALNLLADVYNCSPEEVMTQFVEPLIVDQAAAVLQTE